MKLNKKQKFWKWLFGTQKQQSNIQNVSPMFIHEGKEKTNTKIVTTPRPNIYPAPQPRNNL